MVNHVNTQGGEWERRPQSVTREAAEWCHREGELAILTAGNPKLLLWVRLVFKNSLVYLMFVPNLKTPVNLGMEVLRTSEARFSTPGIC